MQRYVHYRAGLFTIPFITLVLTAYDSRANASSNANVVATNDAVTQGVAVQVESAKPTLAAPALTTANNLRDCIQYPANPIAFVTQIASQSEKGTEMTVKKSILKPAKDQVWQTTSTRIMKGKIEEKSMQADKVTSTGIQPIVLVTSVKATDLDNHTVVVYRSGEAPLDIALNETKNFTLVEQVVKTIDNVVSEKQNLTRSVAITLLSIEPTQTIESGERKFSIICKVRYSLGEGTETIKWIKPGYGNHAVRTEYYHAGKLATTEQLITK